MSLPPRLQQLVDLFSSSPKSLKIQALVDYSDRLPDAPPEIISTVSMEQVHECQTPFFVRATVDGDGSTHLFFQVPKESPTIRGYAGILADGLDGASATDILDIPDEFYLAMGLAEVVTPLRLRGMGAIMARIKQQVRSELGEPTDH